MALVLAGVIGLVALILTPGWLFYFDITPKLAVLLLGTAVAVFGARRAPRWLALLVLASLVSLAASSAVSGNPGLSLFGTNWRRFGAVAQGAVLIFALVLAGHAHRITSILRVVSVASGITALYGIAQYFNWDPILPAAAYHVGEGVWTIVRPPGTLGYVSYFATWLVMTGFLSLALAAKEAGALWRRVAISAAMLAFLAMILTGTRAAMLGLAAGVAAWLWQRGFRFNRRSAVAAGMIVIACLTFYFSPLGWPLRSRMRWFMEDPWGGARLTLWRDSFRMGIQRPLLGYGPEVFSASFPQFQSRDLSRAYPDFAHESPHNVFLDALIAQGIAGPLLLAAFCVVGFRAARRIDNPWFAAAIAAGIVSQQFTVFTIPTALVLFSTIALAAGLVTDLPIALRATKGEEGLWGGPSACAGRAAPPSSAKAAWEAAAGRGPAPQLLPRIWLAPVAVALAYCAMRFIYADYALALAKRSIDSGDARAAGVHYDRYTRWRFAGTSADLWYSRALLDLAQKKPDIQTFVQAGIAADRATRTVEDPFNAWYSKAIFDAARNDTAGAERSLRAAIDAHPKWFKPYWTLARLLRLQARFEEAEREAALAVDLDGGKHPEVSRTLVEIRMQK